MPTNIHLSDPGRVAVWTLKKQNPAEAVSSDPPKEHGPLSESVFVNDLREIVYKADFQDGGRYRSIVKIHSCFVDTSGTERWTMGTGWLIRPDLIVTAGHNVWSKTYGGQSTKMKCWVGYYGRKSSTDKANVQYRSARNVVTSESWVKQSEDHRLRDVALIQVENAFTGKLNVFSYIETPLKRDKVSVGVVGYPGDKSPTTDPGDKGAEMWGEFARISYDLDANGTHMIDYLVSTYGGQSGAPVLWKQPESGKLVAIGTHCYGNGAESPNNGNPIGGKYGNNYKGMEGLFGNESIDLWDEEMKLMDLKEVRKDPGHEESFWSVFREVVKVGSVALPNAGSFLGPVGTLVGTAAGGLLNVVARVSEGSESTTISSLEEAATSRALLAEAALQSVIRLGRSPDSEEVFNKMKEIWADKAGDVAGLSHVFGPVIADCGVHITSDRWVNNMNPDPSARKVLGKPEPMRRPEHGGTINAEFIECLFQHGLKPLEGEGTESTESIVSWTGTLLEKALAFAKPIATKGAKILIKAMVDGLEKREESVFIGTEQDQREIQTILQRTMMADCALQALEEVAHESKDKLNRLTLSPTEAGHEEAIIDYIKTQVQKIGPSAAKYGKETFNKYLPVILKLAKDHLDAKVNGESAPNLNGEVSNSLSKKLSMRTSASTDGAVSVMSLNGYGDKQDKPSVGKILPSGYGWNDDAPPICDPPSTP